MDTKYINQRLKTLLAQFSGASEQDATAIPAAAISDPDLATPQAVETPPEPTSERAPEPAPRKRSKRRPSALSATEQADLKHILEAVAATPEAAVHIDWRSAKHGMVIGGIAHLPDVVRDLIARHAAKPEDGIPTCKAGQVFLPLLPVPDKHQHHFAPVLESGKGAEGSIHPVTGKPILPTAAQRLKDEFGVTLHLFDTADPETAEKVKALIAAELEAKPGSYVALDVETVGDTPLSVPFSIRKNRTGVMLGTGGVRPASDAGLNPHTAQIRTLQLYLKATKAVIVVDAFKAPADTLKRIVTHLMHPEHYLLGANIKFDVKHLLMTLDNPFNPTVAGWPKLLDPSLLAGFVIKGGKVKPSAAPALDTCCRELLGVDIGKDLQTGNWWHTDLTDAHIYYAAADAVFARQAFDAATELSTKTGTINKCASAFFSTIWATALMELAGMYLDPAVIKSLILEWGQEQRKLTQTIQAETGIANPASAQQVSDWLRSVLPNDAVDQWPRTDSGQLKTGRKVLAERTDLHPMLSVLCDLSEVSKLLGSFGHSLLDRMCPATGRIHGNFRIAGTKSGRFSATKPNLQQIPSRGPYAARLRAAFKAEPGNRLVGADYTQLEVRVAAALSGDTTLTSLFEKGGDVHSATAARLLGIDPADFNKADPAHAEARSRAKAVVFATIYGAQAGGIAAYARTNLGVEMSEEDAARYLLTFRQSYLELAAWQDHIADASAHVGYAETRLGRRHRWDWEGGYRRPLALNFPVQGTATEIAAMAMGIWFENLTSDNTCLTLDTARLISQVHDELIVECLDDPAVIDAVKVGLENAMVEAFRQVLPNGSIVGLVDAVDGASWAELKN